MGNNAFNTKLTIMFYIINIFFEEKLNNNQLISLNLGKCKPRFLKYPPQYVLEEFILNDFKRGLPECVLKNKYECRYLNIRMVLDKYNYFMPYEKNNPIRTIEFIHIIDLLINKISIKINYINLISNIVSLSNDNSRQLYFQNGYDLFNDIKHHLICNDAKSMTANEIAFKYGHSRNHIHRILRSNNTVPQTRERTPKL